ncbi:MAG: UDP-2,3-diacylglucosamine diphosphatase [Bdellovibrionota bacterium]
MSVAIFSDLHLSLSRRTDHEALFVKTLGDLRRDGTKELWLLGDIFDLMVGPFEFWAERHPDFFAELEAWQKDGRSVVWIQGNHDFFLDELLEKRGVIVSDDFVERRFGNKRVFLAHGDLVNPDDHEYLKWRAFTRSVWVRAVLKALPSFVRDPMLVSLGEKLSDKSRSQSRDGGRQDLEDLFVRYAKSKWGEGYTGVCLGHSHIESFIDSEDGRFFVNLGSWVNYSPRCALWNPEEYNCPKRYYVRIEGLSA